MAQVKPSILHGAGDPHPSPESGVASGILLKLDDDMVKSIRKASTTTDGLRLTAGDAPKLRIGNRTIPLTMCGDDFENQLFASSTGLSSSEFTFTSIISHRAKPTTSTNSQPESDATGMDAALLTLQSNMEKARQEKEAKEAGISDSVLYVPKNRMDAARNEKLEKKHARTDSRGNATPASPSLNTVRPSSSSGVAPTPAPKTVTSVQAQAMKLPLIHLLAMGPAKWSTLEGRTHIPMSGLTEVLEKTAKQVDGRWQLTDRAFRDLDVWKFNYPSKQDRQSAIDNAVKAYDRMRLGQDDNLWQMLLPDKDRGKRIVLSKLHFGGGQVNRSLTPHYQPTPTPIVHNNTESRTASTVNTPRHGGTTPRPSSKGDIMKRLLSKDPKKARAAEEAKEKKRKEREAAASDREGEKPAKRPATKKTNPNIKSAEIVHSSDEESDEPPKVSHEKKTTDSPALKAKPRQRLANGNASDSSDTPIKSKRDVEPVAAKTKSDKTSHKVATSSKAATPSTTKASAPKKAANEATPKKPTTNGLSAPNPQQKSQRSPQAPNNSRPTAPSPLGAVRPRVASDVSDRGAVGVQRIRQGAETPKGLGITSEPSRKRHDTVTSVDSATPSKDERTPGNRDSPEKLRKTLSNGTASHAPTKNNSTDKGNSKNDAPRSPKRKAEASPAPTQAAKRPRKDETNGTATSNNNSSEDSAVMEGITYTQGVRSARKYKDDFYPTYDEFYEQLKKKEADGEEITKDEMDRLMAMHKRLADMKREIYVAGEREGGGD